MTQIEERIERGDPATVNIRKSTNADRGTLVAAMARAFDDDPVANFFAAQDSRRARRVYDFMDAGLKITERYNEVYTTDGIDGGAFWSPPGKWKMGIMQQLMLMPAMIRACTVRRIPSVIGGVNAIEKHHPHEPHYYLLALGVEPEQQGRGIGTQLMRPVLEMCDRDKVPAYLESSKEKNIPLYERNGFKVTGDLVIPNVGRRSGRCGEIRGSDSRFGIHDSRFELSGAGFVGGWTKARSSVTRGRTMVRNAFTGGCNGDSSATRATVR